MALATEVAMEKAAPPRPGEITTYTIEVKVEVQGGFLPPEKRHVAAYLRGRLNLPEQNDPGQPYRLVALEVRHDILAMK